MNKHKLKVTNVKYRKDDLNKLHNEIILSAYMICKYKIYLSYCKRLFIESYFNYYFGYLGCLIKLCFS